MENYRPITIPFFECSFLSRMWDFLLRYELLSDHQHGFIHGRSTLTAIQEFHRYIIASIEAGKCPVGIFCDLSGAFDCIDLDIVMDKLHSYGHRG